MNKYVNSKFMKYLFLIFTAFAVVVTASWVGNDKITALIFGKAPKVQVLEWKAGGTPLEYGPAIGLDGRIYCGAENYFYCFSPDGKILWKHYSGNLFQAHPVIGKDGEIYSVSPNTIIRFSPEGKPEWTVDAPMTESYNADQPLST